MASKQEFLMGVSEIGKSNPDLASYCRFVSEAVDFVEFVPGVNSGCVAASMAFTHGSEMLKSFGIGRADSNLELIYPTARKFAEIAGQSVRRIYERNICNGNVWQLATKARFLWYVTRDGPNSGHMFAATKVDGSGDLYACLDSYRDPLKGTEFDYNFGFCNLDGLFCRAIIHHSYTKKPLMMIAFLER